MIFFIVLGFLSGTERFSGKVWLFGCLRQRFCDVLCGVGCSV
jgi:hypothetical protein